MLEDNKKTVAEMKSVISLEENFELPKGENIAQRVVDAIGSGTVQNKYIGDVEITPKGIRYDFSHGYGKDKINAIPAIRTVLENGIPVQKSVNWENRGYDTVLLAAPIEIGNEPYMMGTRVKTNDSFTNFELHEVVIEEMTTADSFTNETSRNSAVTRESANGHIKSVLQEIIDVKRNAQETDVRFSGNDAEAQPIRKQLENNKNTLNGMDDVTSIQSDVRPRSNGKVNRTLMQAEIERFYGSNNYAVDRENFGRVMFDKNALREVVNYINNDAEFAAAKAAAMVVKRGIEIDHHKEHKGRVSVDSYTFAAPVELNGKRGNEAVVVQYTNRNKIHTVRIVTPDGNGFILDTTKEVPNTSARLKTPAANEPEGHTSFTERIPNEKPVVKPNEYKGDNGMMFSANDSTVEADLDAIAKYDGNGNKEENQQHYLDLANYEPLANFDPSDKTLRTIYNWLKKRWTTGYKTTAFMRDMRNAITDMRLKQGSVFQRFTGA